MHRTKIPEIFYTNVRKIEPVGGDCIRIYCAIERNGAWEDRVMLLVPIASVLVNAQFVTTSATEILNEAKAEDHPKLVTH